MKAVKVLSVIGLAAFLVLQGLYLTFESTSPLFHSLIGIVGLATGVLMFISLTHWVGSHKD